MDSSYEQTRARIELQLEGIKLEEEESLKELHTYVSSLSHVNGKIKGLVKILPPLKHIESEANLLVNAINEISQSSQQVTSKIRTLDIVRGRVDDCQQRVGDLIDLELCSQGVQTAIRNEEYETGAGHVHRFLSIDQNRLKRTATDLQNVTSVLKAVQTLHEAQSDLRYIVQCKFEEAVAREDLANIERFFKIFPLLGMHDEGIAKFCEYLNGKLSASATKNLTIALNTPQTDQRYPLIFADTLTLLLEGVARIIDTHQPLIETYYGPGHLHAVFAHIQTQCDAEMQRILHECDKGRKVRRRIVKIGEMAKVTGSGSFTKSERIDPKELDLLIQEIAIIHARVELYIKFVMRKILADAEVTHEDAERDRDGTMMARVNQLIGNSEMIKMKHELLSFYLQLEQYFMEESVEKAVVIDTTESLQLTSSMVDDTFFVIRKCIRRAICSGSLDGVCAVINHACAVLENDYCATIRMRLKPGYPSGYLDLTQAYNVLQTSIQQIRMQPTGDTEQSRATFLVALNNADNSIEYVDTLCANIVKDVEHAFVTINANEMGKVESCLSGLASVTANLRQLVEYGMQQLRGSAIKPRINPWVDAFQAHPHQLNDDSLSMYEANEPYVNVLIMNLSTLLQSFKDALTPTNYEHLVEALAAEVTVRLEKNVIKSTFNRLGGLVLDKEVRTLASFLTNATSWSVREKFARLTQMATILNLEKVTEIYDYWGDHDGSLTWRLTPTDVRNVMSLRSDFKADDINKLKL